MLALIILSLAVAGNVDAGRPSVRHVVEKDERLKSNEDGGSDSTVSYSGQPVDFYVVRNSTG